VQGICSSYADDIQNWHIGCPKSTNIESWHTASIVPPYAARIDTQYLQILVEHGVQARKRDCTYIGHATSKRTFCSRSIIFTAYTLSMLNMYSAFDHPQGLGHTQLHKKCSVRFDLYIPLKWSRFPFLLLVARGRHTHHPPYPTKLPKNIADEVIEAIKQQECLDLSARMFCIYITCVMLM
jgi:hypothetical protein